MINTICLSTLFAIHLALGKGLRNRGVKNMEVALGYLLAYYFVLHSTFPVKSKVVFGFFERIHGIEKPSVTSRAVSNFINAMKLSFQK